MGDTYKFGKCIICGKETNLKNGLCLACINKPKLPDFFDKFGFGEK